MTTFGPLPSYKLQRTSDLKSSFSTNDRFIIFSLAIHHKKKHPDFSSFVARAIPQTSKNLIDPTKKTFLVLEIAFTEQIPCWCVMYNLESLLEVYLL